MLVAATGAEALALLHAHRGPIDLLLTDVVMPGAERPRAGRAASAQRPGMPVLYMSGYTADVIEQSGVASDIQLLEKPFTPDGLVRRVQAVLARSRAQVVSAPAGGNRDR